MTPLRALPILSLCALFVAPAFVSSASTPLPVEVLGDIDKSDFPEPSGIAYHPARNTLFVVGDQGDVAEFALDGSILRRSKVEDESRSDLEGVAVASTNGRLYAVVEETDVILEIDPDSLAVLREFAVPREFEGETVLAEGGQGLESIAFVPRPDHLHGGVFFVTNQGFEDSNADDASALFEMVLPLNDEGTEAGIVRRVVYDVIDLCGSYYDAAQGVLMLVSGANSALIIVSTSGEALRTYSDVPGDDLEGITFDGDGIGYLAQDSGGILKFRLTGEIGKPE